jgi:hypothetical protein
MGTDGTARFDPSGTWCSARGTDLYRSLRFLNSSFIPAVRRIFAARFGDERLADGHNFTASAENQVRSGLPAGGKRIRTAGPPPEGSGGFERLEAVTGALGENRSAGTTGIPKDFTPTPIYINHGGISPATGLDGGREPEQNGRRRGDALASGRVKR